MGCSVSEVTCHHWGAVQNREKVTVWGSGYEVWTPVLSNSLSDSQAVSHCWLTFSNLVSVGASISCSLTSYTVLVVDAITWKGWWLETEKAEFDVKIQKSKRTRLWKVNEVCFNRENTGNGEWWAEYIYETKQISRGYKSILYQQKAGRQQRASEFK